MNILILILCFSVFGCQTKESFEDIKSNTISTSDNSNTIKASKENLKGDWIIKKYIDSIHYEKSVFQAFKKSIYQEVFGIYFTELSLVKNELILTNIHEGVEQLFSINQDGTVQVFSFFKNKAKEPLANLNLTQLNNDTLMNYHSKIDSNVYLLIKLKHDLKTFLNSTLFTGTYKLYDQSDLFISDVIFKDSGIIEGFPIFTDYMILTYYNDDIPQCDLIYLSQKNGNKMWLSWKKQNKKILLYEFDDDYSGFNYESKISNMKYKLIQK